jgi:hypothetical protein
MDWKINSAPFRNRREINTAAGTVTSTATNNVELSTTEATRRYPPPLHSNGQHTAARYYNALNYHSLSREIQIELKTTFSKGLINLKKHDTQKQYLINILNTASGMINN